MTNVSFHCRYLRLPVEQVVGPIIDSSTERHAVFAKFAAPKTTHDCIQMLGDQSAKEHTVFRENGGDEFIKTVAVGMLSCYNLMFSIENYVWTLSFSIPFTAGIFDCVKRTWSLYSDNPKTNAPLIVLPLDLKN